jgi:hypothetical protein
MSPIRKRWLDSITDDELCDMRERAQRAVVALTKNGDALSLHQAACCKEDVADLKDEWDRRFPN